MIYKTPEHSRKVALARYYRLRDIELGEEAAHRLAKGVFDALASFWAKVDIRGVEECWLWKGGRSKKGYGIVEVAGEKCRAHRVVWEITRRWVLQVGDVVMHKICDNPPCCNPAHLRKGTVKENNEDMFTRGRGADQKGEANSNARLTRAKVEEMREAAKAGEGPLVLAERFGISKGHVHNILVGRFWKDSR